MKNRILWCLASINLALAAAFILPRLGVNSAVAQGRVERPSDYLLLPGEVSGADRGIVYIIDTSNGQMSAVAFEDSSGRIEVMPPTDLTRIFEEGVGNATPRRRPR